MNKQIKIILLFSFLSTSFAGENPKDKCWITNQAEIKCKSRSYASTGNGPVTCSLTSQGEILCKSVTQPKNIQE